MRGAVTEVDELFWMPDEVRAVEGTSLVAHIGSRGGVAARQWRDHVAIGDGSGPHAIATARRTCRSSLPAASTLPCGYRNLQWGGWCQRRGKKPAAQSSWRWSAGSAAWQLESAGRHFGGQCDGDVGQLQLLGQRVAGRGCICSRGTEHGCCG